MTSGARTTGTPPSANGASSAHLWWELPGDEPLTEVSAVLEVLVLPRVARLYFWALQASFHDGSANHGAAHLGLQWAAGPGPGRAANWGGYDAGGAVLSGSRSELPSRTANPHTRYYQWEERRPYRLRIHRHPGRRDAWRGEIVDLATGQATVVRDLFVAATHLCQPVVWSEVFADCDAPPVVVRWSRMVALAAGGRLVRPEAVIVGYQARSDGGCDNSTAVQDGRGVLQLTNAERGVPSGARLPMV